MNTIILFLFADRVRSRSMASDVERTFPVLRRSGERALANSNHEEAANCFQQAWHAFEQLKNQGRVEEVDKESAIDVLLNLRISHLALLRFDDILTHLKNAETLANELKPRPDAFRLARIKGYRLNFIWRTGIGGDVMEAGKEALEAATQAGDLSLLIATRHLLSLVHHALGNYEDAKKHADENLAVLKGDLVYDRFGVVGLPSVLSRGVKVWSLAEQGRFEDAAAEKDKAFQVAEEAGDPVNHCSVHLCDGFLNLRQGKFDEAIKALERGFSICRASNIPIWIIRTAGALGYTYALEGLERQDLPLVRQGISLLDEALNQAKNCNPDHKAYRALMAGWQAEAHASASLLAAGEEEKNQHAEKAHQLAEEASSKEEKELGHKAWGLRIHGEVYANLDPKDYPKAEQSFREALALAEDKTRSMEPLQAHCHFGFARLYEKWRKKNEAMNELNEAKKIFKKLGMAHWLRKAENA